MRLLQYTPVFGIGGKSWDRSFRMTLFACLFFVLYFPVSSWGYFHILGDARQSALGGPFVSIIHSPLAAMNNPAVLGSLGSRQIWAGGPFSRLFEGIDLYYFDPETGQVKKDDLGINYLSVVNPVWSSKIKVGLNYYSFSSENYNESVYAVNTLLLSVKKWSLGLGVKWASWNIEKNRYVRNNEFFGKSDGKSSLILSIGLLGPGFFPTFLGNFRTGLVLDNLQIQSTHLNGGRGGPIIRWSGSWGKKMRKNQHISDFSVHVGYDVSMTRQSFRVGTEIRAKRLFIMRMGTDLDKVGIGIGINSQESNGRRIGTDLTLQEPFPSSDRALEDVYYLLWDLFLDF
jgi:hypothetical protein